MWDEIRISSVVVIVYKEYWSVLYFVWELNKTVQRRISDI